MRKIQEPEHALILVDANWLASMTQRVDTDYLTKHAADYPEIPRYADGLKMLARHGFGVVIPEMVAYESARILHDGRSPDDYFAFDSPKKRSIKKAQADNKAFLMGVQEMIVPPIPDINSEAACFMNNMTVACDRRSLLDLKSLQGKNIEGYGDMAAEDIVKGLPKKWSKPVFFFSEDNDAYKRLKTARPDLKIAIVNAVGYLQAMRDADLFKETLDIKLPSKNLEFLVHALENANSVLWDQPARRTPVACKDSYLTREEYLEMGRPRNDLVFPFKKMLAQTKDRILAEEKAKPNAETIPELTPEQETRFRNQLEQQRLARLAKFSRRSTSSSPLPGH